jgi:Flp pilus assembly protein TadB
LLLQQQIVDMKQQTLAMKQQTLATKQQIRLAQELAVQEARSAKLTQSILVVLGVAFIVGQIVANDPTLIFWRGLVIIGTALLTTLLVYLLGRPRQRSEAAPSLPSESEEFSNAPLQLPPSDDSHYR